MSSRSNRNQADLDNPNLEYAEKFLVLTAYPV